MHEKAYRDASASAFLLFWLFDYNKIFNKFLLCQSKASTKSSGALIKSNKSKYFYGKQLQNIRAVQFVDWT